MNEKPWFLETVALYSKSWYGPGTDVYSDLNIIFGHICGYSTSSIDRRGLFLNISDCFHYLVISSNKLNMIDDLYKEVLFPWFAEGLHKGNSPDEKLLNGMISGIRQFETKYFGELVLDCNIARMFDNGQERIDSYKDNKKGWVGPVINE